MAEMEQRWKRGPFEFGIVYGDPCELRYVSDHGIMLYTEMRFAQTDFGETHFGEFRSFPMQRDTKMAPANSWSAEGGIRHDE